MSAAPSAERWIDSKGGVAELIDHILDEDVGWILAEPGALGGDGHLKPRRHLLGFLDRNILYSAHAASWSADGKRYDCHPGRRPAECGDMDMMEHTGLIISKMEAATNFLNSIQVNDCRLANRMVQIAKGDDNMSGIVEEMTGYKSIREGYANSWQQSREKIQANKGNPTEDLKEALANCPAEVTDIFKTGSLLAHAAARVGASDWAGVMRARVGDVYMRWDANDKVPLFSAIPACPRQDTESADDFLTGRVPTRALNIPATAADCSVNGAGRGALILARERMEAISVKIRTRAALTTEEKQFVANVRTLPVYRLLEWGVRQGLTDSVIADTDELVALTLAYQMLNDLTRSIDFALQNAERGVTTAGASDAENTNICQTRILTKGIEQLRELRDEALRQRAQMRQSYMAAMNQANLSANYAGVVRQRDRDARDAAGANANRNR